LEEFVNVKLVVVRPFGSYASGDFVSDATAVAALLSSEHADNVVRVGGSAGAADTASESPAATAASLGGTKAKEG
jgi:hypothetical protein